MGYAKTLFLIYNHKSQILEHDILLQQTMGPDDDIHDPPVYSVHNFPLILLRLQTVQDFHAYGIVFQSPGKCLKVLFRQYCSRNQNGYLFPFHGRPERRPQGNFGLPESRIAAHQPVHGLFMAHVKKDIFDGSGLIRCFLVFKGGTEFIIDPVWRGKGMAVHNLSGGVNGNQFFCNLADRLLDFLFYRFPRRAAKLVNSRGHAFGADIPLDLIQPVYRYIEFVVILIFKKEEVVLDCTDDELLKPPVHSDAVVGVDCIIPLFQIAE